MTGTRIFGIVMIVIGAIMLFFSHYIAERVAEGRMQIASGQSKVDTANALFSASPYTKEAGKTVTGSAQRRIDAGSAEAAQYEALSQKLQIGGVVLIVIGIGFVVMGGRRRSS
jgi:hypothetical protein